MSESLQRYTLAASRARSEWRGNWVLPIGSAYSTAYGRFLNTFNKQAKADALKAQLMLSVLTVGIGGAMGAMVGKSAASAAAVDPAMTAVADQNVTQSLGTIASAARAVATSEAGVAAKHFIMGPARTVAVDYLKASTKQQITGLLGATAPTRELLGTNSTEMFNSASLQKLAGGNKARDVIANADVVQNRLDAYVELVYAASLRSIEDMIESIGNEGAVAQVIDDMRSAPFLQSPRSNVLTERVGGALRAELEMELAMYMVLIMNTDEVVQYSATSSSGVTAGYSGGRGVNISLPPGHADYPKEWSKSTIDCNLTMLGLCISGDTSTERQLIRYKNLGSVVNSRIDGLYSTLIERGTNFFQGSMGVDEIIRAQTTLSKINARYQSAIKASSQVQPALVPGN